MGEKYRIAFYVSGHGYGHATRVSALTTSLLASGHTVTIVTNAPSRPFSSVLPSPPASPKLDNSNGNSALPAYAAYRHANVDPGIVQPKAYDVDRKATVEVLKRFLHDREGLLKQEERWLRGEKVQVVLSDSTFLGCAAASRAGIPAAIVSNFSFDSCFSYLSHPSPLSGPSVEPPIPDSILSPLVDQTIADYRCASLLLRLPGAIPIPAFDDVPLPSGLWVNEARTSFTPEILSLLSKPDPNRVIDVPMIVRPPSANVYEPSFRHALLQTMHVPEERWDCKILLVSFGGQAIPRPRSRPPSPTVANGAHKEPGLLPPGWIAIVCGLGASNEIREDLPDGFYASEHDVYVPDLTATCDVVLGKLGYGTCSETLSCKTPMIYVPRPLFIEEFGLKRLMHSSPSSSRSTIELSRSDFEAGRWETAVLSAWEGGKLGKAEARKGWKDNGAAETIVDEVEKWMGRQKPTQNGV